MIYKCYTSTILFALLQIILLFLKHTTFVFLELYILFLFGYIFLNKNDIANTLSMIRRFLFQQFVIILKRPLIATDQ